LQSRYIVFLLVLCSLICPGGAATITVPADYPTIQGAIDQAARGDAIMVEAGYYPEQLVIPVEDCSILGNGSPVIDGGGTGYAVEITANNVTFSGFVLTNPGHHGIVLATGTIRNRISGNHFNNTRYALYAPNSDDLVVRGNIFTKTDTYAVQSWWSDRCRIEGNTITDCGRDGINLLFVDGATIRNNTAAECENAGIILQSATGCMIDANGIRNGTAGIMLSSSTGNTISNNTITNVRSGIQFPVPSGGNALSGNLISGCEAGISLLPAATPNTLQHNTLSANRCNLLLGDPQSGAYDQLTPDNTVNGRPVYYEVGAGDLVVPGDAGQFACVDCRNITLRGGNVTPGGIYLANSTGLSVENVSAESACGPGIVLRSVRNATIENSSVSGLSLSHAVNVSIHHNDLSLPGEGITILGLSGENSVYFNNIGEGILSCTGPPQVNWNSTRPVLYVYRECVHTGLAGNFWEGYAGGDADGDGIGESPHPVCGSEEDQFPLVEPWQSYTGPAPTPTPPPTPALTPSPSPTTPPPRRSGGGGSIFTFYGGEGTLHTSGEGKVLRETTVISGDGIARLLFPKGSRVLEPGDRPVCSTAIAVVSPGDLPGAVPEGYVFSGYAYACSPERGRSDPPAILSVRAIFADGSFIARWNSTNESWEALSSVPGPERGSLSARMERLGIAAVFVPAAPARTDPPPETLLHSPEPGVTDSGSPPPTVPESGGSPAGVLILLLSLVLLWKARTR
jgi:parallel beta-helix repeat protein